MELSFAGELWFWRGPSPFHFVTVPPEESAEIHDVARLLTYGWGVIPVVARIGGTRWSTSLFPKNDAYLVPVKASVRSAEGLQLGDHVHVILEVGHSTQ